VPGPGKPIHFLVAPYIAAYVANDGGPIWEEPRFENPNGSAFQLLVAEVLRSHQILVGVAPLWRRGMKISQTPPPAQGRMGLTPARSPIVEVARHRNKFRVRGPHGKADARDARRSLREMRAEGAPGLPAEYLRRADARSNFRDGWEGSGKDPQSPRFPPCQDSISNPVGLPAERLLQLRRIERVRMKFLLHRNGNAFEEGR